MIQAILKIWMLVLVAAAEHLSGYKHHRHSSLIDHPEFLAEPHNVSVPMGRDTSLTCKVQNVGSYKVAWLRVDTQTILTIADSVITRNSRIHVSHDDENTWSLRIRDVKQRDAGTYMCQINTEPMRSRTAVLSVVVPPDIVDFLSSTDTVASEGSDVSLRCSASGDPKPTISWRREDGGTFFVGSKEVFTFEGPIINVSRVSRLHMGNYLCIASNGVPPSVSKRIALKVQFPPTVWATDQAYRVPLDGELVIDCVCESFPRAVHYWVREYGEIVVSGPRFRLDVSENSYRTINRLTIKEVTADDFGVLRCICKNPLGDSEASVTISKLESALGSRRKNSADGEGKTRQIEVMQSDTRGGEGELQLQEFSILTAEIEAPLEQEASIAASAPSSAAENLFSSLMFAMHFVLILF